MAGFRSRVADVLSAIKGSTIEPQSVNTDDLGLSGARENPFVSNENDLSDVTVHQQFVQPSSTTEYTLVDVSNGPKTLIGGRFVGWRFATTSGATDVIGPVTIDGNAIDPYPAGGQFRGKTGSGDLFGHLPLIPTIYDSSLKIEWEHTGNGDDVHALAYVLGSGPHWAAVVADGERPYSQHNNLSGADIESLSAPEGYHVVKNPTVSDTLDSIWNGVWDESENKFAAHS